MINKELLLSGSIIKFSYKEKKKEWMGEASIFIFIYFDKPKIISSIPTVRLCNGGSKEYLLEQIDEAIQEFENIVFSSKNLAYKLLEAQLKLAEENIFVDLDNEEDYKKVRKIQLNLQRKERNKRSKETNFNTKLLKIYMQGFNDCFDNNDRTKEFKTKIEKKAYKEGWNQSIFGDDVMSSDYKSNEEILERIKEED